MSKVPNEDIAAERARWLAELAEALDEARELMKRLGAADGSIEALELDVRIEAVKLQVQAMRLKRSGGGADFGLEWTKALPWRLSA